MTAIGITAQKRFGLIHLLGDAAIYTPQHGVEAFGTKVFPIPHLPAAVTSLGNSHATVLFGHALSQSHSFDRLVESAPDVIPALIAAGDWQVGGQVIIAGISETRGPESYMFRLNDELPATNTREDVEASSYWGSNAGTLIKLGDIVMSPVPTLQDVIAADFEGIDADADPDTVIWSMSKHLEMQRHMTLPADIGGIGGFAQLTTISPYGITQRVLHRWPDEIGGFLRPEPVDWVVWHRRNPKPPVLQPALHLVR
jgi:hypothetical protein